MATGRGEESQRADEINGYEQVRATATSGWCTWAYSLPYLTREAVVEQAATQAVEQNHKRSAAHASSDTSDPSRNPPPKGYGRSVEGAPQGSADEPNTTPNPFDVIRCEFPNGGRD